MYTKLCNSIATIDFTVFRKAGDDTERPADFVYDEDEMVVSVGTPIDPNRPVIPASGTWPDAYSVWVRLFWNDPGTRQCGCIFADLKASS